MKFPDLKFFLFHSCIIILLLDFNISDSDANTVKDKNYAWINETTHTAYDSILYGNYEKARWLHKKICEEILMQPEQDSFKEIKILSNIGTIYYKLGFFEKAINYYIRAEEIYNEIATARDVVWVNKASIAAYDSLLNGNYDEARRLYEMLYEEISKGPNQDSIMKIRILSNIGTIFYRLRLFDRAIVYYLRAEEICNSIDTAGLEKLAQVQVNLGNSYLKNGDMGNAFLYYENAERIFQNLNLTNTSDYESLLNNFAAFYMDNSNFKKAIEYNEKAFAFSTKDLKEFVKWNSIGFIYYKKKDYKKSLECYKTALQVIERDHGKNYPGKEQILINIGLLYLDLNDFEKALNYLEKCKNHILLTSGEKNASYSYCLNMIGEVYHNRKENTSNIERFLELKRKNLTSALGFYQEALCTISPEFRNLSYSDNPPILNILDKAQLLMTLKNKAEALVEYSALEEKSGNPKLAILYLEDAIKAYKLSAEVIHLIRTGFINQESRLFLSQNEHNLYLGAIKASIELFRLSQKREYGELAFEFSERSRSTDFLTMVRDTRAKQFGGMPDSLIEKEAELKSEISAYKNFVFNEESKLNKDIEKLNLWKTKIFNLEQSYSNLINLFEKKFPKYYEVKYADPIVSLHEVQLNLKPREALIEYVVEEQDSGEKGQIIFFLVTKNKFQIFKHDMDDSYEKTINDFLQYLRSGSVYNTRKRDFVDYAKNAHKLYQWLINPYSNELQGYNFIIVPDGKLAYLPFDALLTSMPDTAKMDFRSLKYMIFDHPVSYSYSATLLYYYFNSRKKADEVLGAFVPNYENNQVNYFGDSLQNQLFALPGAKMEVNEITKMVKGKTFYDKEASSEQFKKSASKFDILHLSMHTLINDTLPMYSKLVFNTSSPVKSFLNTYEIYNMNLNSRMTVLSACNTGSGSLQKGEGVMSLARAFLYAGCPSIIMTLWSVEDESSASLMINFYKNLLNGYTKDEALRRAKLKHIQSADPLKAHPYFWMGYVSVGDQSPLFKSKAPYFFGLIFFIIFLIFMDKIFKTTNIKNKTRFIKKKIE